MLAVLVNPKALKHRRDRGTTRRLARILGDRGVVVETRSLEHLERVAQDLRSAGVDHLAVSGGDGTLGTTLSALRRAWEGQRLPDITPLRGGTMNTISNGLGMPRRGPAASLSSLLASPPGALRTSTRGTLLIDGERVACLFGTGVAYGFMAEYYDAGADRPGPVVAGTTLLRLAGSALTDGPTYRRATNRVPMRVSVRAAGPAEGGGAVDARREARVPSWSPWPDRPYLGLLAGTIDDVGLGFRPFHLLEPGRPGFHLLGLLGPPGRIVGRLARVRRGQPLGPDCALDALVSEARLELVSGEPVRWFADGDLGRSAVATTLRGGPAVTFRWPG